MGHDRPGLPSPHPHDAKGPSISPALPLLRGYLRAGERYELGVDPGSYRLKYVSGPSDEWRGTEHYFGSKSSYRAASLSYINSNQRLSVTFYQTVSRSGSGGGMQKIDEDDF
jgi:hypothetical protein